MSESRLWDYLRTRVSGVDWVRVENPVCPGTPDVNYAIRSIEGWIELKFREDYPKRKTTRVFDDETGLSAEQKIWINRRILHGGTVWICAGVADLILFIPGSYASSFNRLALDTLLKHSALTLSRRRSRDAQPIGVLVRQLLRR